MWQGILQLLPLQYQVNFTREKLYSCWTLLREKFFIETFLLVNSTPHLLHSMFTLLHVNFTCGKLYPG